MANNEVTVRTSRRGTAFVPDLRSYLWNEIGIEQNDVPVTVRLGPVEQYIAVPYRGGAVLTFDASVIRALTGRIVVRGEAPAFGTLSLEAGGKTFESPLNAIGEFYFEDLPPGEYEGNVTWNDRSCAATIRMPGGVETLNDQGPVSCFEDPK
jgi:outer membrane usher protein